jgi:hypothetical protein
MARARSLALGSLLALGRRTVTGMLVASGQHQNDWSAAYRLFERERLDPEALFAPVRRAALERIDSSEPLVVLMDDTLLKKRGRKIAGASWRRDPQGPKFHPNFLWAQRFLQLSVALPESAGPSRARALPIDLVHCPSPRKPPAKASDQDRERYRSERERSKITRRGAERIAVLRGALDGEGQRERLLVVSAVGGFTNIAVLKSLPERTALIGRIRKDAKLYAHPEEESSMRRGRKRLYGEPLPTPEQLLKDDSIAFQTVEAFAAGEVREFKVKTLGPVRWRGAGERDLRLVVIKPLGYRLTQHGRLLYREPAYLVCTNLGLPVEKIVQSYVWRWEIEVNFRDQKTLLGAGQAQVRTPAAVERVPVLIAAAYAFLHLALARAQTPDALAEELPRPRWRTPAPAERCSTAQVLNHFRFQMWGRAINGWNFSDFARSSTRHTKPDYFRKCPASAVFLAAT